jgi:hypothetical protein
MHVGLNEGDAVVSVSEVSLCDNKQVNALSADEVTECFECGVFGGEKASTDIDGGQMAPWLLHF